MTAPAVPSAPAAPAAAGTPPTPEAPKSLLDKQREIKSARVKPVQGPVGGFVKTGPAKAAPVAPDMGAKPTAGAKAGAAPAPVAKETGDVAKPVGEAPAADSKPAPDPLAELKKDRDARARELADVRKQMAEFEELGKTDFRKLVERLAGHYKADPKAVAEALLLEHANKWAREQELAKLSPEERALHEQAERWREHEAGEKVRLEKEAADAKEAVGRESYEATTTKLIEAHKLLPESIRTSPEFNGRAALRIKDRLLSLALAADPAMPAKDFLATVDPAKLAAETMAEYRAELRAALLASSDEDVDGLLTPEVGARWTKRLQTQAAGKAHPALKAQPRAGDGKFVKDAEKPAPKPLSAMRPAWGNFLPKGRR